MDPTEKTHSKVLDSPETAEVPQNGLLLGSTFRTVLSLLIADLQKLW